MTVTAPPPQLPSEPISPPHAAHRKRRRPAGFDVAKRFLESRGPRPAGPLSTRRTFVVVAALSLSALALWSIVYLLVISNLEHARTQHELYAKLRAELALATAPYGGQIKTGAPVAAMTIPGASLHGEVIVEGTTSSALRAGPGHVRTTPLPGQLGASVVYGRGLSFGAPFGRVPDLPVGSPITVTTDQGRFHFRVTGTRHAGDKWVLPAAGHASLTLVTSEGGWMPDRVVYVDAELIGKPAPDPGGRPTGAVASDERAMAGSNNTLTIVEVVLWLQLLVLVGCGITWLRVRWSAVQVWLVGVPCVLAVLWGLSETAVQLLPNLM